MAFSTINKSSLYQNNVLYTGNDSTQSITGVGFQPDVWWNKSRSGTHSAGVHCLYDAVRGVTKRIVPNSYDVESTVSGVTAFGADGVTLGSNNQSNGGSTNYVGWNWKANGAGSSNTDGTITSTVSVNATAGISIVKYTGTGATPVTIGHGLGVVPKMILVKNLTTGSLNWVVYHASIGNAYGLYLDDSNAKVDNVDFWNDTTPTDEVFTCSNSTKTNQGSATHIAYCFAEVAGYSKISSYVGNGNADGTFVYTGFKPSFVLIKNTSAVNSWEMFDNKRLGYNASNWNLFANTTAAENVDTVRLDILSNGFKIRTTGSNLNTSGQVYVYMAFGQPIISNSGICATAR